MGQSGASLLPLYLYLHPSVCLSLFVYLHALCSQACINQQGTRFFEKGNQRHTCCTQKNQARHRRQQGKRQCKTYEKTTKQKQQGTNIASALLVDGVCYACCLVWIWSVWRQNTLYTFTTHVLFLHFFGGTLLYRHAHSKIIGSKVDPRFEQKGKKGRKQRRVCESKKRKQ